MAWVKLGVGIVIGFIGLVWLGQGLNFITGSFMTGQVQWAVLGAALVVAGVWLVWSAAHDMGWLGPRRLT